MKDLLKMENFTDLVKINDEMSGFEKMESIVVENELKLKINECYFDCSEKIILSIEGVQSRILRTAIVQRLIRIKVQSLNLYVTYDI